MIVLKFTPPHPLFLRKIKNILYSNGTLFFRLNREQQLIIQLKKNGKESGMASAVLDCSAVSTGKNNFTRRIEPSSWEILDQ